MEPTIDPQTTSEHESKKLWFKHMTNGYGWRPASWQGGVCLGLWLAAEVFGLIYLLLRLLQGHLDGVGTFLIVTVIATLALWVVSIRHGEPKLWRWGRKP